MTKKKQPEIERRERPTGPWGKRVTYAEHGLFAFRPGQIICSAEDRGRVLEFLSKQGVDQAYPEEVAAGEWLISSDTPFDVAAIVTELARTGIQAEPNVVFFNHSCCGGGNGGGCCGGLGANPFNANPFNANPFNANPFNANPFNANPFNANPFNANPFNANGWAETGERPSSARPATVPKNNAAYKLAPGPANVIILDTGIATKSQLLPLLKNRPLHNGAPAHDRDVPDQARDGFLDPASGHGTFIAGLIEMLAPGHDVRCIGVLNTLGEGDAALIVNRIDELLFHNLIGKNTILNMSFGSYGDLHMTAVGRAIERVQATGAVVVASAGNDGTCLPSFPAALRDVVSVGAIEPAGRAHYSNYGPWVRACAPGTKLVSTFFKSFDGDIAPDSAGIDIDEFQAWAEWTGTSFAGPVVAAALVRHMDLTGGSAKDAVAAVVDNPSLGRYPGLGTVVNLAIDS